MIVKHVGCKFNCLILSLILSEYILVQIKAQIAGKSFSLIFPPNIIAAIKKEKS